MATVATIIFLYVLFGYFYAVLKTPTIKNKFIVWRFYVNCFVWLPVILARCALYLMIKLRDTSK
jgi:hypothetical protein